MNNMNKAHRKTVDFNVAFTNGMKRLSDSQNTYEEKTTFYTSTLKPIIRPIYITLKRLFRSIISRAFKNIGTLSKP